MKTELKRSEKQERKPCECGCGNYPTRSNSRFLPGHDLRKAYKDQGTSPQAKKARGA